MKIRYLSGIILILSCINVFAQDTTTVQKADTLVIVKDTSFPPAILKSKPVGPIYNYKPAIDLPITLAAVAWDAYAFTKIYSKPSSSPEEVSALRIENVNWFDRWVAGNYSEKTDKFSYIPFYGSLALPFFLLFDKEIRKDAGKIGLMWLEAISVTGVFYTGSTYLVDRYRPYTYNTSVPIDVRTAGGAKNSFLAGHLAVMATSTFFTAKVYADYHPESNIKWLLYTGATGLTAWMAAMRLHSGNHFPTDELAGLAVGVGSALLVPTFHKNKSRKRHDITLFPFTGDRSSGVAMIYKFK